MQCTVLLLAVTSFWVAPAARTPVKVAEHSMLNKVKPTASSGDSHSDEAQECAKHARTARDWLRRASISFDIGAAALVVEDGHPAEAAGRHAQLWMKVAQQEEEVAKQSIQAAKLESTIEKFMTRLEAQQKDLFAGKDKLLKRVKAIKLSQADQVQQEHQLKASEKAMEGLRQWPGANKIRIPFEMHRLEEQQDKHSQTEVQLAKNISDVQTALKQTEEEVANWEARKKELQGLGGKLDTTSDRLRERKRELYRQDRLLEGLENLLSQGRDENFEKTSHLRSPEALARRSSIEKLLGKAQARLGAAHVAVQGLLQKLKASDQAKSVKPATMEAMRILSDASSQVNTEMQALGHVGDKGETEALSLAKVAILDVQTGFVTAGKYLEQCMPEKAHATVVSRRSSNHAHDGSRTSNRKGKKAVSASSSEPRGTSESESQATSRSKSSDPAEMLRRTLRAFRSAAEEASADSTSNSGMASSQTTANRLSEASSATDVPDDLQKKIKQLAQEVRAANNAASSLLSTHSRVK